MLSAPSGARIWGARQAAAVRAGDKLEPPGTAIGHRSYDTTPERRLRFVLRARELGFSLDEIRELLRLIDERGRPCAEARHVASVHLADVRAKIDLKRMERVLKDVVSLCGDGMLPECPQSRRTSKSSRSIDVVEL